MVPRRPLLHLLPLAALLLLPAPATSLPQRPGAAGVRAKPFTDDLKWVRGVNYVPSSAHNDMGIWLDYDSALVHQELGYAGKQGFNAVRVFLHWLAWQHDPAVFMERIEDFLAAAHTAQLKVLFVVLDSCFGDVNAEASWIPDAKYRNMTWIPNPGPAIVDAGPAGWGQLEAYVTQLVTAHKADERVLGWDVMNEPAFGGDLDHLTTFIQHFTVRSVETLQTPSPRPSLPLCWLPHPPPFPNGSHPR